MTPAELDSELRRIGRRLTAWEIERRAVLGLAAVVAVVCACGVADLTLHPARGGRLGLFAVEVLFLVAAVGLSLWPARRRRAPDDVARRLERCFPHLDNRVINVLQFGREPHPDPFLAAYLAEGVPGWAEADPRHLRDRRAHRRAALLLLGAAVLLALPGLVGSAAYLNSLVRVLNPFSARPVSSLARILAVTPGSVTVEQGTRVVLACEVQGAAGRPVLLDLWPEDDAPSVQRLGALAGRETETFRFELPGLAAGLRYRFRAADADSPKHTVRVEPPLAVVRLDVRVEPPGYTGRPTQVTDALADELAVPDFSAVSVAARFNRRVRGAGLLPGDGSRLALSPAADGLSAHGRLERVCLTRAGLEAEDEAGGRTQVSLRVRRIPDSGPTLSIRFPTAPTPLPPAGKVRVEFVARDDYGLGEVGLEQLAAADRPGAAATLLGRRPSDGAREVEVTWEGDVRVERTNPGPIAVRVFALDTAPTPNRAVSAPLVFALPTAESMKAAAEAEEARARAFLVALGRIAELQQANLDATRALAREARDDRRERWDAARAAQAQVRDLTGACLQQPADLPAALAAQVADLHRRDMPRAVQALAAAATAAAAPDRQAPAAQAIGLQEGILRVLRGALQAAATERQRGRVSDAVAMLEALVREQTAVVEATRSGLRQAAWKPEPAMVSRQDRLAGDTHAFAVLCKTQGETKGATDAQFAALLLGIAGDCAARQVPADMLRAAEQLEQAAAKSALDHEMQALAALEEFARRLQEWRSRASEEQRRAMDEALRKAQEQLAQVRQSEARVLNSVREVERQKDKLTETQAGDLQAAVADAHRDLTPVLAKVAENLSVFPELAAGTRMIEEVLDTFEQVEQKPGSDTTPANEWALAKEDYVLKAMDKAAKLLEDTRIGLLDTPDNTRKNFEQYDRAELPEIPVSPTPSEMEDLIGDLLEQQEDISKDAADEASNRGGSMDNVANSNVFDNNFVNYSAKGRTGNRPPESTERTGRSIVGRQSMSNGETAAAQGTLREGDPNIAARRTRDTPQDGQVQADGLQDARATGGGKRSGYQDDYGMSGSGGRRAAPGNAPPMDPQTALRRYAEDLYVEGSLAYVRTGALDRAIGSMRRAEEAAAAGRPIEQVREYRRQAVADLVETRRVLSGDVLTVAVPAATPAGVAAGEFKPYAGLADRVPPKYRQLVSEYFKSLSESPAAGAAPDVVPAAP